MIVYVTYFHKVEKCMCTDVENQAYLVASLHVVLVRYRQVHVINEHLKFLVLLGSVHEALAVVDVRLDKRLQLPSRGGSGEH